MRNKEPQKNSDNKENRENRIYKTRENNASEKMRCAGEKREQADTNEGGAW